MLTSAPSARQVGNRILHKLKALLDPQTQSNQPGTPDLERLSALYEVTEDSSGQSQLTQSGNWQEEVRAAAEQIVPPGVYVAELRELDLLRKPYTAHQYARVLLRDRLGYTQVEFGYFDSRSRQDEVARIQYYDDSKVVSIRLASFLKSWLSTQHSIFHEAAHPAAGHVSFDMLKDIEQHGIGNKVTAVYENRLARQAPLLTGAPAEVLYELQEAEADLRAEYGILYARLEDLALEAESPGQFFR